MPITSAQLKQAYNHNPKKIANVLAQALREFGYEDLTDEEVALSLTRITKGEKHKDIIDNFIDNWLENGMN